MKATPMPAAMPTIIAGKASRPRALMARLAAWAETTAASPMVKPTDRSMPAEMMTKVWPRARRSGAVAKTPIDWTL